MTKTNASRAALLVVHLQGDIVSEGTAFGTLFAPEVKARNVLDRCNEAMRAVRDAGGLVVLLRIAFAPDYSDLRPTLPLLQLVVEADCLKDGTPGGALVEQIEVSPDDVVLAHQRPGPFTDSDLRGILQHHSIETVAVCGVATNASVESAVRQASDLGYRTLVVSDASSAADAETHEASLASMGLFATVVTTEELGAALC
ncbi:cysteine hydrolase family protein [Streptomyces sioyaensis]|uniref:cysteine hydrolase family protein n=1 Tax=Streptomyces sioyaensis TaxID=67364 RepID=UPI0036C90966